jgi:hypothetical protein
MCMASHSGFKHLSTPLASAQSAARLAMTLQIPNDLSDQPSLSTDLNDLQRFGPRDRLMEHHLLPRCLMRLSDDSFHGLRHRGRCLLRGGGDVVETPASFVDSHHLSALLQICMSAHLQVCTSACLHIFMFTHLHVCTSARLHICVFAHLHLAQCSSLPRRGYGSGQVYIAGILPFVIAS